MKVLQIIREQETEMGEPDETTTPGGPAFAQPETVVDMYMSLGNSDTERNNVLQKVFAYYNRDVLRPMSTANREAYMSRFFTKFGKDSPYRTVDRYKMNAFNVARIKFPQPSNSWRIISRHFRTVARKVDAETLALTSNGGSQQPMEVAEIVERLRRETFSLGGTASSGNIISLITQNVDTPEKWEAVKTDYNRQLANDQGDLVTHLKNILKDDIDQIQRHLNNIGSQDEIVPPSAGPSQGGGILSSDDYDEDKQITNMDEAREIFALWTTELQKIDDGRLYRFFMLSNPDNPDQASAQRQALDYQVNTAVPNALPMTAKELVGYFDRLIQVYSAKYEDMKDDSVLDPPQ